MKLAGYCFFILLFILAMPLANSAVKASGYAACDLIRLSLRNNMDTVVRLEMLNFQLKNDEVYKDKYSRYYDEALSHYDTKALLKAVDLVARSCPL